MKKLKINCFGEGYVLQKLLFSTDELAYIKKAIYKGYQLEDILYHPEVELFERKLELKHKGLLNSYKNQIEIWFNGKKIQKFQLNDLDNQFIVFPLYHIAQSELDLGSLSAGVYVTEKEIGLINSFELLIESFEIEKLVFHNTQINTAIPFTSCHGLAYNDQLIFTHKTDTVVIEQRYFIVE